MTGISHKKEEAASGMYFEQSKYKDLKEVCLGKFGEIKGKAIYEAAEKVFEKLLEEADYRKSEVIKWHMTKNIFPVLAYYKALIEKGYAKEQAYKEVLEQTQRFAEISRLRNKRLGNMPGAYAIFRIGVKKVMAKNFPAEGWETEWVKNNKEEVHFNLKRCVYYETVKAYDCPELCTVFCKNDTTAFKGYLPRIQFKRSGTIGEGKKQCDFHFIRTR